MLDGPGTCGLAKPGIHSNCLFSGPLAVGSTHIFFHLLAIVHTPSVLALLHLLWMQTHHHVLGQDVLPHKPSAATLQLRLLFFSCRTTPYRKTISQIIAKYQLSGHFRCYCYPFLHFSAALAYALPLSIFYGEAGEWQALEAVITDFKVIRCVSEC